MAGVGRGRRSAVREGGREGGGEGGRGGREGLYAVLAFGSSDAYPPFLPPSSFHSFPLPPSHPPLLLLFQ
jgi:hypothetical protein